MAAGACRALMFPSATNNSWFSDGFLRIKFLEESRWEIQLQQRCRQFQAQIFFIDGISNVLQLWNRKRKHKNYFSPYQAINCVFFFCLISQRGQACNRYRNINNKKKRKHGIIIMKARMFPFLFYFCIDTRWLSTLTVGPGATLLDSLTVGVAPEIGPR